MSTRPRVHVERRIEGTTARSMDGRLDYTSPGVDIEVSFDLHDHESALRMLDAAVANVKAQIEETT